MKTSPRILRVMAYLKIIPTEKITYKNDKDIIINTSDGEKRLILDGLTDEDIPLLIQLEQLKILKSIRFYIQTPLTIAAVGVTIYLLKYFLGI